MQGEKGAEHACLWALVGGRVGAGERYLGREGVEGALKARSHHREDHPGLALHTTQAEPR